MKVCKNKRHKYAVVVFDDIIPCPLCEYIREVVRERRYAWKLEAKLRRLGFSDYLQKISHK